MWGAKRDKRTALVTNLETFAPMQKWCDGSHARLPWGVRWQQGWGFATADGCESPGQMCEAMAKFVAEPAGVTPVSLLAKTK